MSIKQYFLKIKNLSISERLRHFEVNRELKKVFNLVVKWVSECKMYPRRNLWTF